MTQTEYEYIEEKLDQLLDEVSLLPDGHEKAVLTDELNRISSLIVFWLED